VVSFDAVERETKKSAERNLCGQSRSPGPAYYVRPKRGRVPTTVYIYEVAESKRERQTTSEKAQRRKTIMFFAEKRKEKYKIEEKGKNILAFMERFYYPSDLPLLHFFVCFLLCPFLSSLAQPTSVVVWPPLKPNRTETC
jgi:hypothetical protein